MITTVLFLKGIIAFGGLNFVSFSFKKSMNPNAARDKMENKENF